MQLSAFQNYLELLIKYHTTSLQNAIAQTRIPTVLTQAQKCTVLHTATLCNRTNE